MPIMPRKATPQSPEVSVAIKQIEMYCNRTNTSINQLSKQAGVSQPALARFMQANRKSITNVAKKVLFHINKRHKRHNWHNNDITTPANADNDNYQLIESAVKTLWDGNPMTAEFIASFIHALRPALALATAAIGTKREGDGHDR